MIHCAIKLINQKNNRLVVSLEFRNFRSIAERLNNAAKFNCLLCNLLENRVKSGTKPQAVMTISRLAIDGNMKVSEVERN